MSREVSGRVSASEAPLSCDRTEPARGPARAGMVAAGERSAEEVRGPISSIQQGWRSGRAADRADGDAPGPGPGGYGEARA